MKICIYADNHFCEKYSLVQGYGSKYTLRLENQIKSIDWVEDLAQKNECDLIVCLGDFFDKPNLTSEELTALQDIKWSDIKHVFLVGNHESEDIDLECSSAKALESSNREIISVPQLDEYDNIELAYLPYVTESNRVPLEEIFGNWDGSKTRILFSHNDIKGIQMGAVVSQTGYTIEELESNGTVCINGHLHNGKKISDKVLNLGNLTGKDFGEDAFVYRHCALILDTDTFEVRFEENPFAFNFYKFTFVTEKDLNQLDLIKDNAVISCTASKSISQELKERISSCKKIIASRVIISHETVETTASADIEDLRSGDHLQKLIECCHEKLDNTEILEFELSEICK